MVNTWQDWGSNSPVQWDADYIDLDALVSRERRAFGFDGERYDFANGEDLSLTDQENLRRLFVRLWEVEHATGDDDGMLTTGDAGVSDRLDRRVCEIAVYGASGDVDAMGAGDRNELVARMTVRQRNVIRNAFFKGFDGMPPFVARAAQLWITEVTRQLNAATVVEATDTEPTTPDGESTTTSETPLTKSSKKARTSRRVSATATEAA